MIYSKEERGWLMKSVEQATEYQRILWKKAEEEALREVEKAGVNIYYPDKAVFKELSHQMVDELEDSDTTMFKLIERIKEQE